MQSLPCWHLSLLGRDLRPVRYCYDFCKHLRINGNDFSNHSLTSRNRSVFIVANAPEILFKRIMKGRKWQRSIRNEAQQKLHNRRKDGRRQRTND